VSVMILMALVQANLAGSAAILLILLLRRSMRSRFGPLAAYGLWLAAPICVLASLLPVHPPATVLAPAVTLAVSATMGLANRAYSAADLLAGLWGAGAIATAGLFAQHQARFMRLLGPLKPVPGTPGVLRGQHLGSGPFVLGSLRPRIIMPADFEVRFDSEARALVLAHEGVHLARGDAAINGLAALVRCLAWFNPLMHLAARLLRVDQEIACDAAVVARHPDARRLYAETLLGAALTPLSVPFGCHWPATGAHTLKERLTMLNVVPVSSARRKLGLGLTGVIALAGAGAVWAANPASGSPVQKPVWIEKPTLQDLVSVYPKAAEKADVTGMVMIACGIRQDGRLHACSIRQEAPSGHGFGRAALKLSPRFRMEATEPDGHPTAGMQVTIPIKFAIAK
jgi:TonB family protein